MRVRYVPRARAQLRRIGRYIAQDSPTAAQQVVARITEAVDGLATFPTMGRPGRVIGTRELIVPGTPYVVAYRVHENAVEVLAVIHSAQQWPTSF
ncbi:MAG TPA: type II toxin-antitoxin system RelE/ParE family toxin [Chloroflexota bacterium]|nr:type II toxin-antitoxin system RelE/ParE family toxin [Chloroflexota bacterium]